MQKQQIHIHRSIPACVYTNTHVQIHARTYTDTLARMHTHTQHKYTDTHIESAEAF